MVTATEDTGPKEATGLEPSTFAPSAVARRRLRRARPPEATDVAFAGPTGTRGRERLVVRMWQLALLVVLVGLWHLVTTRGWIDSTLARSPGEALSYLRESAASGELSLHTRATMKAVVLAWVLGSGAGVLLGIALGLLPRTERVVSPFLDATNAMPRIALAPLFIILFGIDTAAKVALAFTLVVFIVLSGARAGVHAVDQDWLRLSVLMGANKRQLFQKIFLPVATPAIFAALRLGLVYSLLGVVASELIAARDGLGMLIAQYSGSFRVDAVYGILVVLAIIATTLNGVMSVVERRLLRWRPPVDR